MLGWVKRRLDRRRTARSLYGSIVTQARQDRCYTYWGVPDTAEGRFEMLTLHLAMVLHRLASLGEPGRRLQQALTEVFVVDIDDTLREMTVGDLAVPRQVKRAVAALHARYATYRAAFTDSHDAPLTTAIQGWMEALGGVEGLDAGKICAYIRQANRALDVLPGTEVLAGRVAWPQTGTLEQDVRTLAG